MFAPFCFFWNFIDSDWADRMERRLIVMRHAKSSWDSPGQTDHERPLNERGRRTASLVADQLRTLGWVPQQILSSDSQRTKETCELLLQVWDAGIEVTYLRSLYLAGGRELERELHHVSPETETLLVLGHNPGWQELAEQLSETSITMKTGTAVLLSAELENWVDLFRCGRWKSIVLSRP